MAFTQATSVERQELENIQDNTGDDFGMKIVMSDGAKTICDSYRNIKTGATDEQIYTLAQAIKAAWSCELKAVAKVESFALIGDELFN